MNRKVMIGNGQHVDLHIVATHDLDEAGWDRYEGIGKKFPEKPLPKNE